LGAAGHGHPASIRKAWHIHRVKMKTLTAWEWLHFGDSVSKATTIHIFGQQFAIWVEVFADVLFRLEPTTFLISSMNFRASLEIGSRRVYCSLKVD
jgi:hypothetical protein